MRLSLLMTLTLSLWGFSCFAADTSTTDVSSEALPAHEIKVHLGGVLLTATSELKPAADPGTGFDKALKLQSAQVMAGGTTVQLDWSRSQKIRDELLWWSTPRHGDFRSVYAEVTGRMVFKPLKEIKNAVTNPQKGISADTPVPVVIVESIKIQLTGPDGKASGPQFDRMKITIGADSTEQLHSTEPADKPVSDGDSSP